MVLLVQIQQWAQNIVSLSKCVSSMEVPSSWFEVVGTGHTRRPEVKKDENVTLFWFLVKHLVQDKSANPKNARVFRTKLCILCCTRLRIDKKVDFPRHLQTHCGIVSSFVVFVHWTTSVGRQPSCSLSPLLRLCETRQNKGSHRKTASRYFKFSVRQSIRFQVRAQVYMTTRTSKSKATRTRLITWTWLFLRQTNEQY